MVIPWEEICIQTQPTHFQSVESVLKAGKWKLENVLKTQELFRPPIKNYG